MVGTTSSHDGDINREIIISSSKTNVFINVTEIFSEKNIFELRFVKNKS
jgi:hypothetical protein